MEKNPVKMCKGCEKLHPIPLVTFHTSLVHPLDLEVDKHVCLIIFLLAFVAVPPLIMGDATPICTF
jgi:hypothetical protein